MSAPAATGPRSWPRALLAAGVVAAMLAAALLWRLPADDREWRFLFCENDSLFQLHRIQQCLAQYPRVPSVDQYAHYPRGYRVVWLNLHPLLYATLAKVAGVPDDLDALAALVSWVPPLLGLVALLLSLVIARACTTSCVGVVAVGVLCAFSAEVCRPFFFGTIDHHLFAHLGVLLLVLGRLRERLWLWLLGLAALVGMTPEAIIYVSLAMGCVFASEATALALGSAERLARPGRWLLAPAVVALLVWTAHRSLATDPLPLLDRSWVQLTVFHVAWFAVLGAGTWAAVVALGRVPAGRAARLAGVLVAVAVVALACGAFLAWSGALASIVQRLRVANRIFVGEERFVFSGGFWQAPAGYRLLALSGVVFVVKLIDGVRRRSGSTYWFLWITLTAALTLGLMEYRHLYVLSSLQLIGFVLAALATEQALRRLPLFARPRTRWLPAAVVGLAIVPAVLVGDVLDRQAIHGPACDTLPVVEELAAWLKAHTPDPRPAGASPAGASEPAERVWIESTDRPTYGVFSPWSIGHHLHVLGQRPVVVDPFNYEVESGVEDALQAVWSAATADELMAALARYGVRYLVLTNPAEEIVGVVRKRGLPIGEFVALSPQGKQLFRPALYRFATFRLFMTSGLSGEFGGLQPRFYSGDVEIYTASAGDDAAARQVAVPKGQVYEVKAVAVLTGTTD